MTRRVLSLIVAFLILFRLTAQTKIDKDIKNSKSDVYEISTNNFDSLIRKCSKGTTSIVQTDAINFTYVLILEKDTISECSISYSYKYCGFSKALYQALKDKIFELSSDSLVRTSLLNYKNFQQSDLKNKFIFFDKSNLCIVELHLKGTPDSQTLASYKNKFEEIKNDLTFYDRKASKLYIDDTGKVFWDFMGQY